MRAPRPLIKPELLTMTQIANRRKHKKLVLPTRRTIGIPATLAIAVVSALIASVLTLLVMSPWPKPPVPHQNYEAVPMGVALHGELQGAVSTEQLQPTITIGK